MDVANWHFLQPLSPVSLPGSVVSCDCIQFRCHQKQVIMMICGYGSLTVAIIIIHSKNFLWILIIVRLKGSGAPCLQSCF